MVDINSILIPLYSFYDALFQPLLQAGPYVSLAFFSAALAAVFSIIYYIFLDRERADEIKEKLNKHQEKMKEAQEEGEDDEVSDHLQKSLKLNQKFMMLNMKPMVATMLFVGLIFPWMGTTFAPAVDVNQSDNFTGELKWAGQTQEFTLDNETQTVMMDGQEAQQNEYLSAFGVDWEVMNVQHTDEGPRVKFNAAFVKLPFTLPYIGGALNWLGFYILIAMPLGFGLRKLMGVA
jgi:uncharacterized membrane protein (DUF106 family)